MKKIAIVGVLALLVGLGAGGVLSGLGVKAVLVEEAHAAAELVVAAEGRDDPPSHDPAGPVVDSVVDSVGDVGHPVEVDDSVSVGSVDAEDQHVQDSLLSLAEAVEALAAATREAEAAEAEAEAERRRVEEEGARKLSKIFGAMQAQDAADVLQEMDNEEVELILQYMSDRLAAQILGVFEPARAAALSRVVLGTARSGS